MKKNKAVARLPKLKISTLRNDGEWHHYVSSIKSRIWAHLDRQSGVTKAFFTIIYGPDLKNKSVIYKFPEQKQLLLNDLDLFASESEITFLMK